MTSLAGKLNLKSVRHLPIIRMPTESIVFFFYRSFFCKYFAAAYLYEREADHLRQVQAHAD